jgi:ribonuclease P protein component
VELSAANNQRASGGLHARRPDRRHKAGGSLFKPLDTANAMTVPAMPSFRFRPHEHLRRAADFRRVYERRRSVSDGFLIVYGCGNGLPYLRLGLSVSRKMGNAVRRNRLRRLYREAFRLTRHEMPVGLDLILIPRRPEQPTLAELQQSLPRLVRQLAGKLRREAERS